MNPEKTQEVIVAVTDLKKAIDEVKRLGEERAHLDGLLNKAMTEAQKFRDRVSVLLTVGRNVPERSILIPNSSECVTARLDHEKSQVHYRVLDSNGIIQSWSVRVL